MSMLRRVLRGPLSPRVLELRAKRRRLRALARSNTYTALLRDQFVKLRLEREALAAEVKAARAGR